MADYQSQNNIQNTVKNVYLCVFLCLIFCREIELEHNLIMDNRHAVFSDLCWYLRHRSRLRMHRVTAAIFEVYLVLLSVWEYWFEYMPSNICHWIRHLEPSHSNTRQNHPIDWYCRSKVQMEFSPMHRALNEGKKLKLTLIVFNFISGSLNSWDLFDNRFPSRESGIKKLLHKKLQKNK